MSVADVQDVINEHYNQVVQRHLLGEPPFTEAEQCEFVKKLSNLMNLSDSEVYPQPHPAPADASERV